MSPETGDGKTKFISIGEFYTQINVHKMLSGVFQIFNQLFLEKLKFLDMKKGNSWTGEMAQWLRALTTLPKVLSSISSNRMVAHNHL